MTNDSPTLLRPLSRDLKERPSRSFWLKTMGAFSKSGLSVQEFCRLKKLSPSTFYTWRKRLREEEDSTPLEPASFIPLDVLSADGPPSSSKEVGQNQQTSTADDDNQGYQSGLTLHVNERHKISIDKGFHGATLGRLVQILSSDELSIW